MIKKMQWFNEPDRWEIIDSSTLSMYVTPNTDFWRKTHYGFTVDDGPFYYFEVGGEFEMQVKIKGEYKSRYDQMGLMIRKDEKTWIKTGVEYVNNNINLSAVVTREYSDWSIVELNQKPEEIWIKVKRILDTVEIQYSLDNKNFTMMRLAYFPDNTPLKIGLTAASPDGEGFHALFEDFVFNYLPDKRRKDWLEKNQET